MYASSDRARLDVTVFEHGVESGPQDGIKCTTENIRRSHRSVGWTLVPLFRIKIPLQIKGCRWWVKQVVIPNGIANTNGKAEFSSPTN
jgi:hypothetical protein